MPDDTMPKLSRDLPHPRHPNHCQACGVEGRSDTSLPNAKPTLWVWQECDQWDRKQAVFVVLCPACSKKIVDPHPRLYWKVETDRPLPGVMPLCADCTHRADLTCPLARMFKGQGVTLTFPEPSTMHICRRGKGNSGWEHFFHGPVTDCDKRQGPPVTPGDGPPHTQES